MKNRNLHLIAFLGAVWLGGMALDPSNPPTGMTGAPNEKTCSTQSGCHNGGAYTGTVVLTGVPDTVLPNTTYSLTLTATIANASRGGFQLTCLDASNVACGTLTTGTGTSIATASSRQYIRQSTAKNYSGGAVSWTFSWKSPATLTGTAITFYFSALAANGNGGTSGDNAIAGTKKVVFKSSTTGVNDLILSQKVNIAPNPAKSSLNIMIDDATISTAELTLVDRVGRVVLNKTISSQYSLDVQSLPRGLYLAQIKAGDKMTVKKVNLE